MEHLWSPWRYQYVTQASAAQGCIFCLKPAQDNDESNLVVYRARLNYVILNLYPYTTGHLMVVPYAHLASPEEAPDETLIEMTMVARQAVRHLRAVYRASGFNLGMNLGECAGAGVAGHFHMHVLPRWPGDSSFMTTVGETRVMPEDLSVTYRRLSEAFRQ